MAVSAQIPANSSMTNRYSIGPTNSSLIWDLVNASYISDPQFTLSGEYLNFGASNYQEARQLHPNLRWNYAQWGVRMQGISNNGYAQSNIIGDWFSPDVSELITVFDSSTKFIVVPFQEY